MGNLDSTQRTQFERPDLAGGGERLKRGSQRGAAIYSLIAGAVGVGLCVLAVAAIDNWAQWLVLGVLVVFTVAVMAAVGPNRRGAGSRFKITG
jgi:hypothetical protein